MAFLASIEVTFAAAFTFKEFNGPDGGLPPPGFHAAEVPKTASTMHLAVYSPNAWVQAGVNATDPNNITLLRGLPCFPTMINAALIAFSNGSVLSPPKARAPYDYFVWFVDTCVNEIKCGNEHGLRLLTRLMQGDEADFPAVRSVLGGWRYTKPIAQIAGVWNIPNVGFFAPSQQFSDKSEFPFFLRVNPSSAKMWQGVAKLLRFLNYTRAMIWHSKDERGVEAKDIFFEKQTEWGLDVQAAQVPNGNHVALPPEHPLAIERGGDNGTRAATYRALVVQAKNFNSHVHINAIFGVAPIYDLFHYLSIHRLFGPGYLWIGEEATTGIYDTEYLYATQFARILQGLYGDCPPDGSVPSCWALQTPFDGYVTVRPQQEGARFPMFWAWWKSLASRVDELFEPWVATEIPKGAFADPVGGNYHPWWRLPSANFLFDGMWATLLGINAVLLDHGPNFTGEQFLHALKNLSFEGITGHVSFDAAGDRRLSFEILQYMRPCPTNTDRRLHEQHVLAGYSTAGDGSLQIPHLHVANMPHSIDYPQPELRRAQTAAEPSECPLPAVSSAADFLKAPFQEYLGCLSRNCEDMHPAFVSQLTGGAFKNCPHVYAGMCKKCGFDLGSMSPQLPLGVFLIKDLCVAQCPRGPTTGGQPAESLPACPGYPLPPQPLSCYGYPAPGQQFLVGTYSETLDMSGHPMQFHGCSSMIPPDRDLPCEPGHWYDRLKAVCEVCAVGRYATAIGQSACDSCPPGTFASTEAQSACIACKQGSFTNQSEAVNCTSCDSGRFQSEIQQSGCRDCEAGTYAAASGSHACERCPLGTYVAETSASRCLECRAGRSTQFRSSDSERWCFCKEGTFSEDAAGTCMPCPDGMICAFASDLSNWWAVQYDTNSSQQLRGGVAPVYPRLEPQFWSDPDDPLNVFQCATEKHCPGGDPGTCAQRLQDRSCSHCIDKYYWNGDECATCSSLEGSKLIFPVLPLAVIPFLVMGLYALFGDPVQKWDSWANHCASLGFVLLSNYQVIDLLSGLKMHKLLKTVTSYFAFTNDLLSVFRAQCLGVGKFKEALLMQFLCPLAILFWTLALYGGAHVARQMLATASWCKIEKNRLFNVYMSLIFTFFNAVSSLSMALFKCRGNPNELDTLSADLSIICYTSGEWQSLLGIAVLAILFYCVGCGIVFLWAICAARSRFSNPDFQMRWKFLFIKFRPDVWWFALAYLSKHVLLNLSFAVSVDLTAQLCMVLLVLVGYSFFVCIFMPYRMPIANALEIAGCICTSYLCIILLTLANNEQHQDTLAIIGACLTGVPLLLGFAVLSRVASAACPLVRKRQWEQQLRDSVQFVECIHLLSLMDQKLIAACLTGLGDWDRRFIRQVNSTIMAELFSRPTRSRCSTGVFDTDDADTPATARDSTIVQSPQEPFSSRHAELGDSEIDGKEDMIRNLTRRLSVYSSDSMIVQTDNPTKFSDMPPKVSAWSPAHPPVKKSTREDQRGENSEELLHGQWQPPREMHVSMMAPGTKPNPSVSRCHNRYAPEPSTVGHGRQ